MGKLDPARHRREAFRCESEDLTLFLQQRARKEMDACVSACFVLVPIAEPHRIAGYYTLSAAEIVAAELPADITKRLPRYRQLPATLLGRLARDETFRGQGIGDRLMHDALRRAYLGSREVGSVAIVTDPKDKRADAFYRAFGFRPLSAGRLFLPMAEVGRLIEGAGA